MRLREAFLVAVGTVLLAFAAGSALRADVDGDARPSAIDGAKYDVVREVIVPPPTPEAKRSEVRVPILVYHHIRPDEKRRAAGLRPYEITPAEFEAHLRYLRDEGYSSIGFKELREAFDGGPLPEKPVIITFDDGRANQYEAWKTLRSYGFHGTWFVFTNAIDRPDYLTWAQLAEMRDAGGEVEGHTRYHLHLTKLSDEELVEELRKSSETFLEHMGAAPTVLAYPFGESDERVVAAARDAGYTMARGLGHTHLLTSAGRMDLGGWTATGDMRQFKAIFETRAK